MSKITFDEDSLKMIIHLYTVQHMSVLKISNFYSVNPSVIIRVLKENNITIRDNNCYKSKKVDENFFHVIDTQEKAYILGFFFADGCLTKKGTFGIKIKDKDLLERIKKELKSSHKIIECKPNKGSYSQEDSIYYGLYFTNKQIEKDLKELGVDSNKTTTCSFPIIPKELERHFIRGFFDGDGSVYKTYSKKHDYEAICVSFVGTQEMLIEIRNRLKEITGSKSKLYKSKNVYDYKIGGINQCEKLYHYLYDDATIFLGRKKNVFEEFYK